MGAARRRPCSGGRPGGHDAGLELRGVALDDEHGPDAVADEEPGAEEEVAQVRVLDALRLGKVGRHVLADPDAEVDGDALAAQRVDRLRLGNGAEDGPQIFHSHGTRPTMKRRQSVRFKNADVQEA